MLPNEQPIRRFGQPTPVMEDKVTQISSRRAYAYLAVSCAALVAPLSGCVALLGAGAGAGGATYVASGGLSDYQAYYPVSLGQATAASRAVLGEIHMSCTGNLHKMEKEKAIY